jgi:tRNA A-37 threonylcarbamoyl transferase component Bud32
MQPLVQLMPGMVFAGDYEVIRPLAQGGMGAVYVVRQRSTAKQRALKVLHPQFAVDGPSRERFVQEARVAAEIDSDHVTEVVGAGVDPSTNTPWIAMELLDGEELAAHVERVGALSREAVRELIDQLCDALAKAHAKGIVHRDLKPENLFVARARRRGVPFTIKVLDFGIAKAVADNATAAKVSRTIGSPLWMAPEQAQLGARLTPATDVWALGLIVFYLLTGKYFWRAPNAGAGDLMTVLNEVMLMPIEPASVRAAEYGRAAALPAGFDAWFARCVDRDATRRWPHAGDAWQALERVLGGATAPVGVAMGYGTQAVSMVPEAPVGVAARTQAWPSTVSAPMVMPTPAAKARSPWVVPGVVAAVAVVGVGAALAMSGSSAAPAASITATAATGTPPTAQVEHHTGPEAQHSPRPPTPVVAAPVVAAPVAAAPVAAAPVVAAPVVAAPVQAEATGWDAAQACRRSSGSEAEANNCIVRALRSANGEREMALLANTYRAMGNRPQALATMRRYIQRYPGGPQYTSFQRYVDANSEGTPGATAAAAPVPAAAPANPFEGGLPERLSASQIRPVMSALAPSVRRCAGGRSGMATVTVTIGNDGVPRSVALSGVFRDTPEGACMERVVGGARFARFRADSQSVTYPYVIQPPRPAGGGSDFGDLPL